MHILHLIRVCNRLKFHCQVFSMNKYIKLVLRRPVHILIMLAIFTAVLVPGMTMLKFDNSVESFMPKR